MRVPPVAAAVAGVVLLLCSGARADLTGACYDPASWGLRNDATVPGTFSPISGCVASTLTLDAKKNTLSDLLIGGKGSGTIMGIPAGSDSGGCTDPGRQCMSWCQALCCLAPGCKYAEIYAPKSTSNDVVTSTTSYSYYCRLFSAANYVGSSNQITCAMLNNQNCASTVMGALGVSDSTYQYLMYNRANATCSTPPQASGRRLQGLPPGKVGPFTPASVILSKVRAAVTKLTLDVQTVRNVLRDPVGRRQVCQSVKSAYFNHNLKCWK